MAKNKKAYVVLLGSIQDGPKNIPAGQLFTPDTTEFAKELLDAKIIGPLPADTAKEQAEQAAAEAKAQAEAEVAADDTGAGDEGDGEDHDADAGSTADDDTTE